MGICKLLFLVFNVLFVSSYLTAQPMIILEYSKKTENSENNLRDNHENENYSTYHRVKKNEALSNIIQKYYGNKGLNLTFIQAAIIQKNKSAFVRSNPNFMFANKNLYLPSVNEIKELVYHNKKNSNIIENEQTGKDIYFFGN